MNLARLFHTVVVLDNREYRNDRVSYMHMVPR